MQIPDYVVKNNKLSSNAKFLYGLILENSENEICIKDNNFFSSCFYGVTERTIRNYLTELKNEGLIAQINYQRIRNAIFILNKQDLEEVQKIKSLSDFDYSLSELENIFRNSENIKENDNEITPILKLFKDIYNLVLVSKENKNYIYKESARACETTFSTTNSVNKFSSYETAGSQERVREFDYKARCVYTNLLFKDFFEYHSVGKFYDTALEIVDNMIEVFNQSQTEQGFVFDGIRYNSAKLLDVYMNITQDEFSSIVSSVSFKEDIKTRSPYIIGALFQAGRKLSWKKTNELVKRGCPWDSYVPTNKQYQDIFEVTQKRVLRDKEFNQFKQEFQRKNTC